MAHRGMNSGDKLKGNAKADSKLAKSPKGTKGGLATSARGGSGGYHGDNAGGGSKGI